MDKIRIVGGRELSGAIRISGAKNAALPALFASLLTGSPCRVLNLPKLRDTDSALAALSEMGADIGADGGVCCANLRSRHAPYRLVKTMRASILALGPLTAKWGEARVALPGGCAIGARPVNEHLRGLAKLGAKIQIENGDIFAKTPRGKRLKGARILLDIPSVTATENLMMAACLAEGETVLENAAREPEVADLAALLAKMGAKISGAGESVLRICGVAELGGAEHRVIPDRIEAGTYLAATAACGGEALLRDAPAGLMDSVLEKLRETGAEIESEAGEDGGRDLRIRMRGRPRSVDATTGPHPGFPTDMQAQLVALNCVAEGSSAVTETVFENRFMHALELARMGADIRVHGNTAHVRGVGGAGGVGTDGAGGSGRGKLLGAPVMATDLRASASLAVAALAAHGETRIDRVYHLDRGYERMDEKLRQLGADAERIR